MLEFVYKILRLPGEPQMTRFLAEAVTKSHWFDISAARRDLGYSPGVSTTEGLIRLENWLNNEHVKGVAE